ncbi:MAG: glycosyltransferase family 4 protein [Thermodesulfobacteriota bacterium]|jgi:glycosyltransferase involved in cell wall biosynthesis|nr:MAG: glycosyltransferase family 4 protein [Thermodesulfobacteriota bacterium]
MAVENSEPLKVEKINPTIKLVIITNMLSPYRIPLFENISQHPHISLDVVVNEVIAKERSAWQVSHINFPYHIIQKKTWGTPWRNFGFCLQLIGLMRRLKPQVIVSGGFSLPSIIALLYSHNKRIPFYIWSGETILSFKLGKRFFLSKFLRKFIMRFPKGFLAYGPAAKDYLLSCGVPPQKIAVINNICNAAPFMKVQKQKTKNLTINMLYVGECTKKKNVLPMLKAYHAVAKMYPDLQLTIVGGGPLVAELGNYVSHHNLQHVFLKGEMPSTKIPGVMAQADFLILPSVYDLWPHVVMEAMATGLPVLCSETAGIPPYIVQDGINGFFISPSSEKTIAQGIEKMMAVKERWKQMGLNSSEIVQEYTIEKSAQFFIEAIMKTFN